MTSEKVFEQRRNSWKGVEEDEEEEVEEEGEREGETRRWRRRWRHWWQYAGWRLCTKPLGPSHHHWRQFHFPLPLLACLRAATTASPAPSWEAIIGVFVSSIYKICC